MKQMIFTSLLLHSFLFSILVLLSVINYTPQLIQQPLRIVAVQQAPEIGQQKSPETEISAPTPQATKAAAPQATPEPTAEPESEPEAEPERLATPEPTPALQLESVPEPTPAPTARPSPRPTKAATKAPTPEPVKTSTRKPAPAPTAKATPKTTPKATPEPTPELRPTPIEDRPLPKGLKKLDHLSTPKSREVSSANSAKSYGRPTPERTIPPGMKPFKGGNSSRSGSDARQVGPSQEGPKEVEMTANGLPGYYLDQARMRIKENFRVRGEGYSGKSAVAEFTVLANGTIIDVQITRSAGSPDLDELARNALTATKLAPLPDSTGLKQVRSRVTFNFD